jgi:excisionase family DNA binding protein
VIVAVSQIAEHLGLCPRTVAKLIDSGELKGYRLPCGGPRRCTVDSLNALCDRIGAPRLEVTTDDAA